MIEENVDFKLSDSKDVIPEFDSLEKKQKFLLEHPEIEKQLALKEMKEWADNDELYNDAYAFLSDHIWYSPSLEYLNLNDRYGEPVFTEISDELSALYRLYEFSRRYINKYLESQEIEAEERNQRGNPVDKIRSMFMGAIDSAFLPNLNQQSILVMLYSFYERSLKKLIIEIPHNAHFFERDYTGSTADRYISFLRRKGQMNIVFSSELERDFDTMRLVRNYFVHDGSYFDNELVDMINLSEPSLVVDGSIKLSHEYMLRCFDTVGKLLKDIEKARATKISLR